MAKDTTKTVFKELDKYIDIIEFVRTGSKDIKEISKYLKSINMASQTSSTYLKNIREGKSVLLKCTDEGVVSLDMELYMEVIEQLQKVVKIEAGDIASLGVVAAMGNLQSTSVDRQKKIDDLNKQVRTLKDEVEEYKEKSKESELLRQELLETKQEVERVKLQQPTVIISSEEILPRVSEWEKQFVKRQHEEQVVVPEEVKDSAPVEDATEKEIKKESFILNRWNYIKRSVQKILNDNFILDRVKTLLDKQGKEEFIPEKGYVKNLLNDENYTNQEKLALYAAFSEYRHSDFEKLLNFAGDNNVNADLLIQWVESLGDEVDFMQIKNALRQFAKPTEYQMKYELARELLLGHWQVEFVCNGEPVRFRLVSEKDIEMIRNSLHLSESAFTYHDYVTYEMAEKAKKEKEEAMVKKKASNEIKTPNFIKRFVIKDDDIEEFDLDSDIIDYDDFEKEDEE